MVRRCCVALLRGHICDEDGGYYLSAHELLLVCELRSQNIAVFGRRGREAAFLGAITGHESALVLVVPHLGEGQGRVRSHFQRLALEAEIREAEEQQCEELHRGRSELKAMAAADLEAAWRNAYDATTDSVQAE